MVPRIKTKPSSSARRFCGARNELGKNSRTGRARGNERSTFASRMCLAAFTLIPRPTVTLVRRSGLGKKCGRVMSEERLSHSRETSNGKLFVEF